MTDFEHLTQLELARAHGVTPRTIRDWTVERSLPRNADGSYSLPETIRWRCQQFGGAVWMEAFNQQIRELGNNVTCIGRGRSP